MRYGSNMGPNGLNPALAARLHSYPPTARPILETVVTRADAIKDTKAEFFAADSFTGFQLVQGGGVQLSPTNGSKAQNTTRVAGNDITSLVPPISDTIDAGVVVWGGGDAASIELRQATAYLNPNTGGGQNVTAWVCQLFRFHRGSIGTKTEQIWELQPISAPIRATAVGSAGNITFGLVGAAPATVGPPPLLTDAARDAGMPQRPVTIMFVWALQAGGAVATNVAWECDSGNSTVADGVHVLQRRQFTALGSADSGVGRRAEGTFFNNESVAPGVPAMSLRTGTYSAATLTYTATGVGTPVDLGGAPSATTVLEVTAQHRQPADSTVQVQLNATGAWVEVVDGDVIGVDNSSQGGTDLSGMNRQQSYDIRAILTPSNDAEKSPVLFRMGVRELSREQIDGIADFEDSAIAVDPLTCQSEVPSLNVVMHKDGVRDYRSYVEDLLSQRHLNELEMRVFIGHPDLPRKDWLHVDNFLVEDYDPAGESVRLETVSPLKYMLETIPPKTLFGLREPINYATQTLAEVWADLHTGQVGVAARYLGPGPTATQLVQKEVRKKQQAIDVRQQLDFIAGRPTISSQGRFKSVRLFDDEPPAVFFERNEIEILGIDTGYRRRITSYDVPYGWTEGDGVGQGNFADEREHSAATGAIVNLGRASSGQLLELDEETAKWIPTATLADAIGERMVRYFGTGLAQIRFRSDVAWPNLEPGDAVAIEQDDFAGRDPIRNTGIRGPAWVYARITQVHNQMGTEFTAWVVSWVNFVPTAAAVQRRGFAKPLVLESTHAFTASGGLVLRIRTNREAAAIRVAATATDFPSGTVVDGKPLRALDGTQWAEYQVPGNFAIGQTAWVSAKAYETTTGGGAASSVAKIKVGRIGTPGAGDPQILSGAMEVTNVATGDIVYRFSYTLSTGVTNANHDIRGFGRFATSGGWDVTATQASPVGATGLNITNAGAGTATEALHYGELALVATGGNTLQTLTFSQRSTLP